MKSRAKQWIGSLLAVCLVMAMLPTAALAADTGKAIQLVSEGSAGNLGGGQADNVYFGNYYQSNNSTKEPVKWRVLSNTGGQLFLLADQNLEVFQYHTEEETVTWETSTMRSWLNGYGASSNTGGDNGTDYTGDNFLDAAFSAKEQNAIVETAVVNDDNKDDNYGTNGDGGNDTNDRIFLLSIAEADNRSYFPKGSNSRFSANTVYVADGGKLGSYMYEGGETDRWWLRSPGFNNSMAACIDEYGGELYEGNPVNNKASAVRPAFNLNLENVLFTSAATGGKSASGMDSGLTAVEHYSGNEWKLTLLDGTRGFSISNETWSGNTLTFSYSGAQTGTNEYLSAVILENGAITCYGRILQSTSASGTANLSLPSGVALSDTTTLYVFNEQVNGNERTDYASALSPIPAPAAEQPPVITSPTTDQKITVAVDDTATLRVTAKDAQSYQWYVDRGNGSGFTKISGATGASYTTSAVTLENDGYRYYCAAMNAYGEMHSPIFTLNVQESVEVPPTGDSSPLNVQESVEVPPTGDSSQMGLWFGLALLSFAGLAACATLWRRKRAS